MIRRYTVPLVLLLVTIAAVAVAIWLGTTATSSAPYPPVQIGDRTVGGAYSVTTLHGDRVGGATAAIIVAVATAAAFVGRVRAASRR